MTDYLVINLPDDSEAPADWVVVDNQGASKSGVNRGPLAEAAVAARDLPVIVLAPSADVVTTTADLPVKSGPKLRAAIPFALEEQFAADIDDLHFAHGSHRASGKLPVAVVETALMDAWLDRLRQADIHALRIVPAYHGVQRMPNTLSLVAADNSIMLNDGGDLDFAMDNVAPGDALLFAGLLDDRDPPASSDSAEADDEQDERPRHLVAYCDEDAMRRFEHDFNALRSELDSVDVNVSAEGPFVRLAAAVAAGQGVNLLQGPYARRTEYSGLLRPWRTAASLLLGIVVLSFVAKGVDFLSLSRQEAALTEQYTALYQSLTGDSRVPGDPLGAADSVTRQLIGSGNNPTQVFLPSIVELAKAIQASDDTDVQALSYRAGVIDVRLRVPDVATLDRIQRLIGESGRYTASIQGTTQDGDGNVNSRIQIRDTGA